MCRGSIAPILIVFFFFLEAHSRAIIQVRMREKIYHFDQPTMHAINLNRQSYGLSLLIPFHLTKPKASARQLNRECLHCNWLDQKSHEHYMLHWNCRRNHSPRKSTESCPFTFTYWQFYGKKPARIAPSNDSRTPLVGSMCIGRSIRMQLTYGK